MCGICGFITPGGLCADEARPLIEAMSHRLVHRGPDAGGHWLDPRFGVALGHRRLAVVEPGAGGAQPMTSRSGRYVLVLNGEIYNHRELHRELVATIPADCGHSDTGVLLGAIDRWGLPAALGRCVGMFALALWDQSKHRLLLARDRIGEKPLFWGLSGATLLFGSGLKSLRPHPAWTGELDRSAIRAYLQRRFVPSPSSIFHGIHKLPPGHWIEIDPEAIRPGCPLPAPRPYWNARELRSSLSQEGIEDPAHATAALAAALGQSVAQQMIADVPLGVGAAGHPRGGGHADPFPGPERPAAAPVHPCGL